jgi:hypothetical protein
MEESMIEKMLDALGHLSPGEFFGLVVLIFTVVGLAAFAAGAFIATTTGTESWYGEDDTH